MSAATETPLPGGIPAQLERLRSRLLTLAVAGGAGLALTVITALFCLALITDYLFDLPVAARISLLLGTALAAIATTAWWVIRPMLRSTNVLELAAIVEDANPRFQERLLSALELSQAEISPGEA